jgi:hypothetical protein
MLFDVPKAHAEEARLIEYPTPTLSPLVHRGEEGEDTWFFVSGCAQVH